MNERTIRRVAIIGAGISGVVSAGHLLAAGIDVTVFERSEAAGGVWLYDKRVPIEAQYPCVKPSDAKHFSRDDRDENERQHLLHAPPGPCYESLTNNVSTPLLRTTLSAWPEGTPPYVNHGVLKDYIQGTSRKAGVEDVTVYGALVTKAYKEGHQWHVFWKCLHKDSQTASFTERESSAIFDAVVVASGHYHTPLIPDIPGLAEKKANWPSKITHSKSFRSSNGFEGKNVLLIGGGVSSVDIAREISPVAQRIYQSTRNGAFDIPASALPQNASRVEQVAAFKLLPSEKTDERHLPIVACLVSGEEIRGIDRIILCTGYQMTLPFLPQYNDDTEATASDAVLVTDGTQIHNLHRDIFYIPDPSLVFVGIPFYTATFTLFEFQAIAVAAWFSGTAQLPSTEEMKAEYKDRKTAKGQGRAFHSLRGEEETYVKSLIDWVNAGRVSRGLDVLEGHTDSWREEKKSHIERLNLIFQGVIPYGN
ncbi:hypothetical protein N7532_004915 [Penicillium argentinense]|uniref:Uncharacterized protein n=1 Tax=Penicillium argentinense TaxID=1131581 RepID=A0A9W9FD13_9EURO|nr:uncharacterized protein N7532_004915 [Penicillium argentinense]KAJ5097914.1 hypothetical protein N7532_004915 [Penicillium argentinense]